MTDVPHKPFEPQPADTTAAAADNAPLGAAHVLYPQAYVWYVFLAALDVMFTYLILHPIFADRGVEMNVLASWVIHRAGLPGMAVYKFALVLIVVTICELVGRRRYQLGRRLAEWCVAISAVPIIVAVVQMVRDLVAEH